MHLTQEDSQLVVENSYLRGALVAREEECLRMRADRVIEGTQHEALLRAIAELVMRISTLSMTVTALMAEAQVEQVTDLRDQVLS